MIILKILLITLLSLLVLFALILSLNIYIKASFSEELALEVRILFIKLRILPQNENKKKDKKTKKKKTKKKKDKADKKEGKESKQKRNILKEKGLSGFLTILKELLTLSSTHLLYLLSKTKARKLEIYLAYAGDDAAQTAIGYGKCCAVVYPAAAFIVDKTNCKAYSVEVVPNFDENAQTKISALFISRTRIFHIGLTALKFLIGLIKLKIQGIF